MACTLLANTGLYFDENGNPCDPGSGGGTAFLNDFANFLGTVGTTIDNSYKTLNAPTPVVPPTTLPQSSTTKSISGLFGNVSISTILILVALGIGIAFAFRAMKK